MRRLKTVINALTLSVLAFVPLLLMSATSTAIGGDAPVDDVVRNSGATTGSDDSTADLRYALDDVARKLYATHVVGKISDVSPLLLENADESGAIAYSLTYAADTALMAGWVSLYNCDLSEFVAAQFLGMSKGAENRQYKFDGLNTEHVYALFISAVADEVSSDQLSILVHVEQ